MNSEKEQGVIPPSVERHAAEFTSDVAQDLPVEPVTATEETEAVREIGPNLGQKSKSESVIYFVTTDELSIVKIGRTRRLRERLSSLRIGSPVRIYLIGTAPGDDEVEREWHRRYEHKHGHGEWFHMDEELLREIADACGIWSQTKRIGRHDLERLVFEALWRNEDTAESNQQKSRASARKYAVKSELTELVKGYETLSRQQTANLLGVTETHLAFWRHNRTGPKWVIYGRHSFRYIKESVLEWVGKRSPVLDKKDTLRFEGRPATVPSHPSAARIGVKP